MFHDQEVSALRQPGDLQCEPNPLFLGGQQNEVHLESGSIFRGGEVNLLFSPGPVRPSQRFCLKNSSSGIFSTAGSQGETFGSTVNAPSPMSSTSSLDPTSASNSLHPAEKPSAPQHASYLPHPHSFAQQSNGDPSRRGENSLPVTAASEDSEHGSEVGTVKVFDTDFQNLLTIPLDAVRQFPPPKKNITRWVLCRNYLDGLREKDQTDAAHSHSDEHLSSCFSTGSGGSNGGAVGGCSMGSRCNFVHVAMDKYRSQIVAHPVHINYVWGKPEDCTYTRLPGGITIKVLERIFSSGNGSTGKKEQTYSNEPMEVDSSTIIYTAAFGKADKDEGSETSMDSLFEMVSGRVFRQCEQFHGYSFCPLAGECTDVHVIHIDPSKCSADHKWVRPKLKPRKHQLGGCGPSTPLSVSVSGTPSFVSPSPFRQAFEGSRRGREPEVAGPLMSRGCDAPLVLSPPHASSATFTAPGNTIPGVESQNVRRDGSRVVPVSEQSYALPRDKRPVSLTASVSSPAAMSSWPLQNSLATSFSTAVPPLEGLSSNNAASPVEFYAGYRNAMLALMGSSSTTTRWDGQVPQRAPLSVVNTGNMGPVSSLHVPYSSTSTSAVDYHPPSMMGSGMGFSSSQRFPVSPRPIQGVSFFKEARTTENEMRANHPVKTREDDAAEDDELLELLLYARQKYDTGNESDDD